MCIRYELAIRVVLGLGDGAGGGKGGGVRVGGMNWNYGMDGEKGNEVISTAWYVLFIALVDFDFRWSV